MKKLISILALTAIFGVMIIGLTNCEKEPDDPRAPLYNKWWTTADGLGDYIFHDDGTYEYQFPIATGTYTWYLNADSVLMQQDGGGSWSIWFHSITDSSFVMSQGNENHQGMYNYTPKP